MIDPEPGERSVAPEDEARARGYLAGERGAFQEVDSWIRSEVRRRYPGLRREHDDLIQSVHERLVHNLRTGRFEGRSALQGYVVGILHYAAIGLLRRRYREPLFTDLHPTDLPTSDNPYRDVELKDERAKLVQVLIAMPAECRRLWTLIFVDRLPYEETARTLAVPVGTVKSRMWYCRRKATAAL